MADWHQLAILDNGCQWAEAYEPEADQSEVWDSCQPTDHQNGRAMQEGNARCGRGEIRNWWRVTCWRNDTYAEGENIAWDFLQQAVCKQTEIVSWLGFLSNEGSAHFMVLVCCPKKY